MHNINESFLVVQEQQLFSNIYPMNITDEILFDFLNIFENLQMNISKSTQFRFSTLIYMSVLGLVCACLCFLTIVGNLLVLITFRRIRTVGNLFILSLATADLVVGCFVMPLAGIYAIMEEWKMGSVLCKIWISVDFIASTASIFNLLTLSLDRYWSITSPLQYLGKRTRTRALLLIGFAWGLSLLWIIPIFGWEYFYKDEEKEIDLTKCEPGYTHSKVLKVSTAILNFYLPLLVLMSLNGRIYYEIKRRYKSVLLQRHCTKINDSITNNNSNSLCSRKPTHPKKKPSSPITVTLCDIDRQLCSTTINYSENESLVLSKVSPQSSGKESILRIHFKERKHRPMMQIQNSEQRRTPLKRAYSYIDRNHCAQDELTWFARRREHFNTSFTRTSSTILPNYKSRRLCTDGRCLQQTNDYHSCRIFRNKQRSTHNYYQTACLCQNYSLVDREQTASSLLATSPTTMNVFNLCHCCSAASATMTIQTNSSIETYAHKRRTSTSSSSSIAPAPIHRKQPQPLMPSLNRTNSNPTSSLTVRSTSLNKSYLTTNKVRQTTLWNQQEKAFRQLFAIVFGFTCCFLPYFILYMVIAFCNSCVSERAVTATIWLGYVNSTINPFLYALSNKHFRRTFNRLFKRNNHRQSYYN